MTKDDIVDTLNDLIETSKDGEYGFRTSAEYLKSLEHSELFARRADECHAAASDLQKLVEMAGGTAEESGSMGASMHRGWVAVKAALSGYSDKDILEDIERGEDLAIESYRKALEKSLPADLRAVVERQFEGVKRNHAEVRTLRNRAREASL